MADKDVVITIKTKSDTSGAKEAADAIDNVSNKSKEASNEFGIADTKVGQMWNSFKGGAEKGIASMKTLKGAIAATGIGLLVIAVAGLINYFKKTDEGSEKLEQGMAALGTVIKEGPIFVFKALKVIIEGILLPFKNVIEVVKGVANVITGKKGLKEAFNDTTDAIKKNNETLVAHTVALGKDAKEVVERTKESIAIKKAEQALEDEITGNSLKKSKIETEIIELREKAITNKKANIDLLKKEHELYLINKSEAEKELAIVNRKIANENDMVDAVQLRGAAEKKVQDVETAYVAATLRSKKQLATVEKQETEDKRKQAEEDLKIHQELIQEKLKLYQNEQEQVKNLRQQAELDNLSGIEREKKTLEQKYFNDYLLFMDNEEAMKLLKEQYLRDYAELEAKGAKEESLKALDIKMQNLDTEYILKDEKDAEYYEQKREIDLERIEDEDLTDDERKAKRLEIEAQYQKDIQDLDKETADKKKANQQQIFDATLQTINTLASAVGSIWQSQMEEELKNTKLTDKEKEKIRKQYFEKEKKLAIVMAVINGAVAFTSALRTQPVYLGIILAALTAVSTAAQIAVIASKKYALGGVVKGQSHANGGVIANMEGGEAVINARSMQVPGVAESAAALNDIGNGKSSGSSLMMSKEELTAAIINGIVAIPVYIDENGSFKSYKLGKAVETRESKYVY